MLHIIAPPLSDLTVVAKIMAIISLFEVKLDIFTRELHQGLEFVDTQINESISTLFLFKSAV